MILVSRWDGARPHIGPADFCRGMPVNLKITLLNLLQNVSYFQLEHQPKEQEQVFVSRSFRY